MLAHGWTYQALVSDCLDMKLNRVLIAAPERPRKKELTSEAVKLGVGRTHVAIRFII